MARASEWTTVRRRVPARRLAYLLAYLIVVATMGSLLHWILATEPEILDSGEANPTVQVKSYFLLVAAIASVFILIPLMRPAKLLVNHYGLRVRPNSHRELLIPWTNVEELAAISVGSRRGNHYLLIATDIYLGRAGSDRPGFMARSVLREANRATEGLVAGFDLAVRLDDFKDPPPRVLAELASHAPGHVQVIDRLK
ncbi:hypothetical protein [Natronoglycomyces albus]|uniref:PH domain-containing protein n=1 Tax=Natronoglycomyces albus TaxID=2811108 RepID=A0A895XSN9_9ACTN|nr:hypothetical protein [Natronoglycomyces albus]QSB05280.1 hypothetical protein JQS30_16255 [Natronoglycomyces albus]